MSAIGTRLSQLEARYERTRLELQDVQRKLTQALQQIRDSGAKYIPTSGTGSCTIFIIPSASAIAIAAGSSGTSNVWALSGGSLVQVATSATIYNEMQQATVTSKTMLLGANGDGSFTVITQSC